MPENPFFLSTFAFEAPREVKAAISSADFRVGLEILMVPYAELFFVAPTGSDLGARERCRKS